MSSLRVGIAGVHGHGRGHVDAALALAADRNVELVAVADPRGGGDLPGGVAVFDDAGDMIDRGGLDIVILSTPIPTHAELTLRALAAGAHVLLEKPPVVSVQEHGQIMDAAAAVGRSVQVGFQSLASDGVAACRGVIASGTLGDLRGLAAVGHWRRSEEYWRRSSWAGRRTLEGRVVADGAVTNPLAHSVATALAIAGAGQAEDVASLRLDLYRANDIEVDDTSSLVIGLRSGIAISGALSLTAPTRSEPYVLMKGTSGYAIYHYTLDILHVFRAGSPLPRSTSFARTGLLTDLVDHIVSGRPLAVPLGATGAFTRVLEAIMTSPEPTRIPAERFTVTRERGESFRIVHEIQEWCERAAWDGVTFAESGAPWAQGAATPTLRRVPAVSADACGSRGPVELRTMSRAVSTTSTGGCGRSPS